MKKIPPLAGDSGRLKITYCLSRNVLQVKQINSITHVALVKSSEFDYEPVRIFKDYQSDK